MKSNFYIASITFGLFLTGDINVYAQHGPMLCICFEPDTDYIDLSFSEDSTMVAFNIVLEGFETNVQRQKAWEEYRMGSPTEDRYPIFYNVYATSREPEKRTSLHELDDCAALITVDEYRSEDFRYPPGVGGSRIIFIQKMSDGTFHKWIAVQETVE